MALAPNYAGGQAMPESMLAQPAQTYSGLQSLPDVQRSQYLTDALRSMQESAPNIRTGGALASNLMAEALLQMGRRRSDRALLGQIQAGQKAYMDDSLRGTGIPGDPSLTGAGAVGGPDGGAPPPPGNPGILSGLHDLLFGGGRNGAPPAPPATPPMPAAPPPAAPDAPPPGSPTLSTNGSPVPPPPPPPAAEAPPPPPGPAATPAAAPGGLTGQSFFNQFFRGAEGHINAHDANGKPSYWGLNTAANPDVTAQTTPEQAAQIFNDRYFVPSGAANMPPQLAAIHADTYGLNPSWAKRALAESGGDPHQYMLAREGLMRADLKANPAVRPYAGAWANRNASLWDYANSLGSPAPSSPGTQDAGAPPVGQGPMGGAAPAGGPGMGAPGQGAPSGAPGLVRPPPPPLGGPGAPAGPPTGPKATPAEIEQITAGLRAPPGSAMWAEAMARAHAIQQRASAPIELNKDEYFGADGSVHSAHQLQDVQSASPNAYVQRDPVTGELKITNNPAYGLVPQGTRMDPSGQVSQLPVQQRQTFKIPGTNGTFVTGPDGTPQKVGEDAFSPKDMAGLVGDLTKSDEYTKATHATNMYRAAVNASGRKGGMSDAELIDFAAQEISGGVARQFNQHMIEDSQGPIARLKQFAPEIISGQKLSPGARQALLMTMKDYAVEAQSTFGNRVKSSQALAQGQGFDLSPYTSPLMNPLPDVPDLGSIPNGMPGVNGGDGSQPGQQPSPDQRHSGRGAGQVGPGNNPGSARTSAFTRQQLLDEAKRRGLVR